MIPNAISIVTTTNTKGHFFASFLSRDAAHDLLMAAWRKSFPCAANASAAHNNAYFRQNRSNVTLNDDDDADSFISARPASDSRRNRHRRSSSASQNWTADEADWDETGEDMDGKSSVGSHRRGSKRATVKKIFKGNCDCFVVVIVVIESARMTKRKKKLTEVVCLSCAPMLLTEVIGPILPDDDGRNGNFRDKHENNAALTSKMCAEKRSGSIS